MRKRHIRMLLAFVLALAMIPGSISATALGASLGTTATAEKGTGTAADPYQIWNMDDLLFMIDSINSKDPAYYPGKYYALKDDIDLSSYYTGALTSFPMIEDFNGVLDGCGKTISNFKIKNNYTGNLPSTTRIGFCKKMTGGEIKNITFKDVDIGITGNSTTSGQRAAAVVAWVEDGATLSGITVTGAIDAYNTIESVGAIAGQVQALTKPVTIRNCFFKGTIKAQASAGAMFSYMKGNQNIPIKIYNCISMGNFALKPLTASNVSGVGELGGFTERVSKMNVTIANNVAYSGTADLDTKTNNNTQTEQWLSRVVGLAGRDNTRKISNNLGCSQIVLTKNGSVVSVGNGPDGISSQAVNGTAKTAAELQTQSTYEALLNWDFTNEWDWDDTNKYPVPKYVPGYEAPPLIDVIGDGSASNPYQINSEDTLIYYASRINYVSPKFAGKNYILTKDISLTKDFKMIDNFSGVLDGQGYTISGLSISETPASIDDSYRAGFIRTCTGTVKNLALENSSVTVNGTSSASGQGTGVGILVGELGSSGTVSGCMVAGSINAAGCNNVAGIAAIVDSGATVTDSRFGYSGNSVDGKTNVGGIAAYTKGTIQYCIAMGNLTAHDGSGGAAALITAYQGGSLLSNAAYCGTITTSGNAGSIYASSEAGSTSSNNVAGDSIVGIPNDPSEVTKKAQVEMEDVGTYKTIGWDFVSKWEWDTLNKYPVPKYTSIETKWEDRIVVTMNGDPTSRRGFTWHVKAIPGMHIGSTLQISTTEDFATPYELAGISEDAAGEKIFQAVATGLTPDKTYYYRIKTTIDSFNFVSDSGSFKTAPNSGKFTFIDVSDSDSSATVAADTINKAKNTVENFDFVVHNGDFVGDASNESQWAALLNGAQETLMNTTLVPVPGEKDGASGQFINHFNVENPSDTGAYYSFNYSNMHFVVLNSNDVNANGISQTQLDWLKTDVTDARSNPDIKWVIVSVHKGPYLTATDALSNEVRAIRQSLVPLMDSLGIDLVLQGHDHLYARTKYLKSNSNIENPNRAIEPTYTEVWNGKRIDYTITSDAKDGTIYYNVGSATSAPDNQIVPESYIRNYFERSEQIQRSYFDGQVPKFSSINIDNDCLTVKEYMVFGNGQVLMRDGFGIDKGVPELINQIDGLSTPASILEARAKYDSFSNIQKKQISNYNKLLSKEAGINGAAASANKWMSSGATSRQVISVRNDTKQEFNDAPVLIKLNAQSDKMAFYYQDGTPLPFEIEHYGALGSVSSVWVKVPKIPAYSTAFIWVYYGDAKAAAANDSTQVWRENYQVVEHFMESKANNASVTDSTYKNTGVVTGGYSSSVDTDSTRATFGLNSAYFDNTKIQYSNVAEDCLEFSFSAIVSIAPTDLAAMPSEYGGIISKRLTGSNSFNTANLAIRKTDQKLCTEFQGVFIEGADNKGNTRESPTTIADGKPHLITFMRDGGTSTTFVDGKIIAEVYNDGASTYSSKDIPLTIGAYSNMGSVAQPFKGTMYDVQITGARTSEWWEEFKYSNYFRDAVTVGDLETKTAGTQTLIIDIPTKETRNYDKNTLEAGLIKVYGAVSYPSTLTCEYNDAQGELVTVDCGPVPAGAFEKEVPINTVDKKIITFKAAATSGSTETATYSIELTLQDTIAPSIPDTTVNISGSGISVDVTPVTADKKKVNAELYVGESLPLTSVNAKVYEGSIKETVPVSIVPDTIVSGASGTKVTDTLTPVTHVTDGTNPYQMYEISLTPDQQNAGIFHLTWKGDVGGREATAYLYDNLNKKWEPVDIAGGSGEITIDKVITNDKNYISIDGKVYLLILRGLTHTPADGERLTPNSSQYDFTMFWDSDTQLQTESQHDQYIEQAKWVAENYKDQKGIMQINTGDLVNFSMLSREYQWRTIEEVYKIYEENKIPYAIAWGNHDYENRPNLRLMMHKYFPPSKFEKNAGDWTMGGYYGPASSNDTDAAYYTIDVNGAKILLLTLGYFCNENPDVVSWAQDVIKNHQDYQVILATHYINDGNSTISGYANYNLMSKLVNLFPNVKLGIGGHIGASSLAIKAYNVGTPDERRFYSALKEYQDLPYGGMEYLSMIHFDLENGYVYFETYSPMEHQTANPKVAPGREGKMTADVPGRMQYNKDEFAVPIDFGGGKERTLKTNSLILSLGEQTKVAEQETVGNKMVTLSASSLDPAKTYQWFVKLTDQAGHETSTTPKLLTMSSVNPDMSIKIDSIDETDGNITVSYTAGADVPDGKILGITAFAVDQTAGADTKFDGSQPVAYQDLFKYDKAGNHTITFKMPATTTPEIAGADSTKLLLVKMGGEDLETVGVIKDLKLSQLTHTVTFRDWNGTVLKTETVNDGAGATAPANPSRVGYTFIGWDKTFSHVTSDLTVTAQYTVTGGTDGENSDGGGRDDSGAGDGNSDGGGRGDNDSQGTPVPPARIVIDPNGNVRVITSPNLNKDTRTASVQVDTATLSGAFEKAAAAADGVKKIVIEIPKVEGAKAYEPTLPASFLAAGDATRVVEIKTGIATMTVPGNMLAAANATGAKNVSLTIASGDKSKLNAAVKAKIGDRPVIELNLKVDGKQIVWSKGSAPVTVTIPYTPTAKELKDPEHITVMHIDGSGKAVTVSNGRYDPATGKVTFTTTNPFSRYAIGFVQKTFDDLNSAAWAKNAIEVMASKEIINGTGKSTYSPTVNITRADYLVLLVKTLGLTAEFDSSFEDVKPGMYYYEAAGIAKKLGITVGSGNNKFNPKENISRQDMMVLTARALEKYKGLKAAGDSAVLDKFKDKADIVVYAMESLATLVKEELITGSGNTLNPHVQTTRAEAAVFLYRIYNKYSA